MKRISILAALAAALTLPPPALAAEWDWPVRGDVVTPYRNGDDPYASGQHRGIDIAAPAGTRVASAAAGRVTFVGAVGSSGLTVSVRTADGRFDLSYLHLGATAVHEGQSVGAGDAIGAVGMSGPRSVGQPHLHFGVREAGERHAYRDPLEFLPPLAPPGRDVRPLPGPAAAPDPVAAPPAASPAVVAPDVPAVGQALAPGASAAPAVASAPSGTPAVTAVSAQVAAVADRSSAPAGERARSGARVTATAAAAPLLRGRDRKQGSAPVRSRRHQGATDASALGAGPHGTPADPRAVDLPARRPAGAGRADGVDLGWLAALAGLIAASLCLGRPQQANRAARRGRAAVGAVLRPLTGRA